ncbi:hypothetical protein GKQ23_15640 [Erwinia sp. E602]|uniref:hypothetical protein n=1 Tax=Erwinia sp. E602 TaxID=2675378 RepID=UPI001BA86EAA|nr:hypothetical protein [Erwinia sp. E602]QUG76346.1 hypothetical protein GKQ23_15640 [Erwinia sp. E602]
MNKLPNRNEQGVIFIDLSRMLYTRFAEYLRLSESDLPFSNEVILQRFRDDFDTEIKNLIQKKAHKVASGVAMIVIHYRFPLLIDGDGDGGVCNYLTFNHFCMMFGNDSDKVKFLASSMRESVGNQFL